MKLKFLLLILLFCNGLYSQITLDVDDAPVIGDTLLYVTDTLVAGISVGASGPAQNWDFSDLGISETLEIHYISPEDAPNNDAFPDANLVQEIDGIFNFVQVDDNGIIALGSSIDFFGNGELLIVPFDPPQTFFEFPANYGDSFNDTSVFVVQIEDLIFGVDSLRATQVTYQEVSYDAYGTLTTPGGTYETLRREVVLETMTTLEGQLFGNWFVIQEINNTTTDYEWIAADGKTQVLTITMDAMGNFNEAVYQVEELIMGDPPVADFLVTTSDGSTFEFTDESTNDPTSWFWDFGDGTTSELQNPTHTFAETGMYTVCLIASNFFGADTTCQQVEVLFPPVAAFSYAEVSVGKFSFTDESTGSPETWFWDFGDGSTSSEQNPTHDYSFVSMFTVCLVVSNPAGADTTCQILQVVLSPEANFGFEDQGGGTIKFSDVSSNNPTGWDWDFGDGGTSSEQDPTYTYSENGVYTVCLKASNSAGSNTICKEVEVVVTSLNPLDPTDRVVVVPNPAQTQVEIFTFNHQLTGTKLEVFNLLGQKVFGAAANPQMTIDVSRWSRGTYFYLLQNREGKILERGKLQVQ